MMRSGKHIYEEIFISLLMFLLASRPAVCGIKRSLLSSVMSTFSLQQYDWLGFDMDHSLIRYKPTTDKLIYEGIVEFLHTTRSDEIDYENVSFSSVSFDDQSVVKGCVLDLKTGDFLQIDCSGRVTAARHGFQGHFLSLEDIKYKYGSQWSEFEVFSKQEKGNFVQFNDYFTIPAGQVYGILIDYMDKELTHSDYSVFRKDINAAKTHIFSPEALSQSRGKFFRELKSSTGKYIHQRNDLLQWLKEIKKDKQRIFLLTNSRIDFTALLMSFAFGKNWKSLFDIVISSADKGRIPGFTTCMFSNFK